MKLIGIVGCGTMGRGIAQAVASAGFQVNIFDRDPKQVEAARLQIELTLEALERKGKLSESRELILARICSVSSLEELQGDLIIEAAAESYEVKAAIFSTLESANATQSLIVSNTSSLEINRLAKCFQNPARFAGLHFFNPAPVMKLVEIVRSEVTSPEVITVLQTFVQTLGKVAVVCKDSPGFIVNRVARPFYVESLRVLEDGVAPAKGIDQLMRSVGFRMGPFELMDLIGIDINYSVTSGLYTAFGESPRFKPSAIQKDKVERGDLGRKTGKGFYEYQAQ